MTPDEYNAGKRMMITGIAGAAGVALGALGAHWLKARMLEGMITETQYQGFETGVRYHMFHILAMLAVIILAMRGHNQRLSYAFRFFFAGICLFSGSLYLLSTRALLHAEWLRFLGPVTPVGGVCLILGWLYLAFAFHKKA